MRFLLTVSLLLLALVPTGIAEQSTIAGDGDVAFFAAEFEAHFFGNLSRLLGEDPFAAPSDTLDELKRFPKISPEGLDDLFGSGLVFDIREMFRDRDIDLEGGVAVYALEKELIFVRGSREDIEMVSAYLSPLGPDPPVNLAIQLLLVGIDESEVLERPGYGLSVDPEIIAEMKPGTRELIFSQTLLSRSGQRAKVKSGWELIDHSGLSAAEIDELDFLDRVKSGGMMEVDAVTGTDGRTVDLNVVLSVKQPGVGGGIGYASEIATSISVRESVPAIVRSEPWAGREGWRVYLLAHIEMRRPSGKPRFNPGPRTDRAVREWRELGAKFTVKPVEEE